MSDRRVSRNIQLTPGSRKWGFHPSGQATRAVSCLFIRVQAGSGHTRRPFWSGNNSSQLLVAPIRAQARKRSDNGQEPFRARRLDLNHVHAPLCAAGSRLIRESPHLVCLVLCDGADRQSPFVSSCIPAVHSLRIPAAFEEYAQREPVYVRWTVSDKCVGGGARVPGVNVAEARESHFAGLPGPLRLCAVAAMLWHYERPRATAERRA